MQQVLQLLRAIQLGLLALHVQVPQRQFQHRPQHPRPIKINRDVRDQHLLSPGSSAKNLALYGMIQCAVNLSQAACPLHSRCSINTPSTVSRIHTNQK